MHGLWHLTNKFNQPYKLGHSNSLLCTLHTDESVGGLEHLLFGRPSLSFKHRILFDILNFLGIPP